MKEGGWVTSLITHTSCTLVPALNRQLSSYIVGIIQPDAENFIASILLNVKLSILGIHHLSKDD